MGAIACFIQKKARDVRRRPVLSAGNHRRHRRNKSDHVIKSNEYFLAGKDPDWRVGNGF